MMRNELWRVHWTEKVQWTEGTLRVNFWWQQQRGWHGATSAGQRPSRSHAEQWAAEEAGGAQVICGPTFSKQTRSCQPREKRTGEGCKGNNSYSLKEQKTKNIYSFSKHLLNDPQWVRPRGRWALQKQGWIRPYPLPSKMSQSYMIRKARTGSGYLQTLGVCRSHSVCLGCRVPLCEGGHGRRGGRWK